jgi:hypothetical protein
LGLIAATSISLLSPESPSSTHITQPEARQNPVGDVFLEDSPAEDENAARRGGVVDNGKVLNVDVEKVIKGRSKQE